MNLHAIAFGVVSAVNPPSQFQVLVSHGSTRNPDGSRTPAYADPVTVMGDVQALSAGDIRHLDSLNIQGVQRAIYLNGRIDGLVRLQEKGGDIIVAADGKVWLVNLVLEYWDTWCKVAVTLQNRRASEFGCATP